MEVEEGGEKVRDIRRKKIGGGFKDRIGEQKQERETVQKKR